MFLERALVEQLQTEGAREVLRMPLPTHCSDTLAWQEREGGREGRGVSESESVHTL